MADADSGALSPSRSGTRIAYEKLQALALAENLALDGGGSSSGSPPPPPPIDLADVLSRGSGGGCGNGNGNGSDNDNGNDNGGAVPTTEAEAEEDALLLVADNDDEDTDEGDSSYEVTWSGGPLGLLFKAGPSGRAVIRRVNKKGAAAGLSYARAGDVLVALDGESVERAPFLDVIARLKAPRFPVRLEFRPLKMSELAAAVSGGPPSSAASPTPSNKTVDMRQVVDASYVVVPRPGEEAAAGGGGGDGRGADAPGRGRDDAISHQQQQQQQRQGEEDEDEDEYDVVWDEGPLGCELKQRNGLPTVKSVTGTGTTPSVAQIAAGDILIGINGLRTDEIGFKSTVTLMMRATKPVYLRFYRAKQERVGSGSTSSSDGKLRSSPGAVAAAERAAGLTPTPLEPQQYTVLWKDGPLGIQIRTSSKGRVVVSRLTGAGDPAQLEQVAPGDIFVRIAGVEVDALGIAGAFDLLRSVKKPVVLVFQKRRSSSRRMRRPKEDAVSGEVPSFRQLREEWARQQQQQQQQQPMHRPPHMARAQSGGQMQPGPSRWSKLERAGSAQVLAASFAAPRGDDAFHDPYSRHHHMDVDAFSEGDLSQRSYDPSDFNCDLPSPRLHGGIDPDAELPPPAYAGFDAPEPSQSPASPPPAFANVQALDRDLDGDFDRGFDGDFDGEAVGGAVPDLPPPPSYMDVFTQSGRPRDSMASPLLPPPEAAADTAEFTDAGPGAGEPSPRSDMYSISSEMAPNPHGGALPPSFDVGRPLPPPPEYTPGLGISNARTRLQELRRQYLESERLRNQSGDGYAFSDDAPAPPPAPFDLQSEAATSLEAPELQIRWADGPLGITFKRKHGRIVVSRLTGQGYSPGLSQLQPGDWLVSFNGQPTQELRLSQTMELLKREPKPVVMCFVVVQ